MKKILIICDIFPPQWAPRMGYLCKYLKDLGWAPFILTFNANIPNHDKDYSHLVFDTAVERINISQDEREIFLKNTKYNPLQKIKIFILPDYNRPPGVNEKMYISGIKILNKCKFDLILCSVHQITPLAVAKRLAQRFNIPWVADLRDIVEQNDRRKVVSFREKLSMQRIIFRRNYLLRKATATTSVSPWHVNLLKKINHNSFLIYNGFDPELFQFGKPRATTQFTICYTGVIDNNLCDPSFCFIALSKLIRDNVIKPDKLKIIFYSNHETHEYVMREAKRYNIEFLLECMPFVKATVIPEILHQSNILLMLTNKSDSNGQQGIMTTKFFEYLGTGRPILLTRSDESFLEQALLEAKAGIAARTVDDAYNFIKEKHTEWQKNGFTTGTTDERVIFKYSRKEQAHQFVRIFNSMVKYER